MPINHLIELNSGKECSLKKQNEAGRRIAYASIHCDWWTSEQFITTNSISQWNPLLLISPCSTKTWFWHQKQITTMCRRMSCCLWKLFPTYHITSNFIRTKRKPGDKHLFILCVCNVFVIPIHHVLPSTHWNKSKLSCFLDWYH